MKITVKEAHKVWTSPDNKVSIWDVTLDNGVTLQTKSERIAVPGWSGEVESYAKNGKNYVRQAPKDIPAPTGSARSSQPRSSEPRTFKADPVKMRQDMTLEVARNLSIQRQVAVKGAVDLIVAGKREYAELEVTFYDLMALLSKDSVATGAAADDDDQPPIENYTEPPVEDEEPDTLTFERLAQEARS